MVRSSPHLLSALSVRQYTRNFTKVTVFLSIKLFFPTPPPPSIVSCGPFLPRPLPPPLPWMDIESFPPVGSSRFCLPPPPFTICTLSSSRKEERAAVAEVKWEQHTYLIKIVVRNRSHRVHPMVDTYNFTVSFSSSWQTEELTF